VLVTRVRAGEAATWPASRDLVLKRAREVDLGSAGLPAAVQIAARPWQEHVALVAMVWVQTAARSQAEYPHTPCQ
jgi:fatty acid amide hydrolase